MDTIHKVVSRILYLSLIHICPIVIVSPSGEGFLKGTGRSIDTVDIYGVLKKCDDKYGLFERFGGHKSACGFLMAEDKLPLLRQAVQEEMDFLKEADPHIFDNGIPWDLELDPAEITVELAETCLLYTSI